MKISTLLVVVFFTVSVFGCNQSTPVDREKVKKLEKAIAKLPVLQQNRSFDFSDEKAGALPNGWSQYFTGRGSGTDWKITDDNGNKVLAQLSSEQPNYHFNVVVYDGFKAKNMTLKVRMKGVKGRKDQGGGFVWRFLDKDNYYVVRANPLEDNVVLYKVVDGKRTDLPVVGKGRTYGVDVPPLGNDWMDLELQVAGDIFTVILNGKEIFKVKDDTFTGAGKVGLWTKADAVSYFDDFVISAGE